MLFFFSSQLDVTDRKSAELRTQEEKSRFEQEVMERTAELRTALGDLATANLELQRALDAKTVLLHEVDHRVKNNLQIIGSLIGVQHRRLPPGAEADNLLVTLRRVEALATVHRRLYQSDNVRRFAAGAFMRDLAIDLVGAHSRNVALDLAIDDVEIASGNAAPLALTLNEIMTLHLKALPRVGGEVHVTLQVHDASNAFEITIRSNAAARPTFDDESSFERTVLSALSRQLGAQLERCDTELKRETVIRMNVS